jgi:ribosomal protein S18 acetylase RimI-like enzyme
VTTIRHGRPEDLEAIRAFSSDTFAWGDYVPDSYMYWLDERDGEVLVAVDDQDVAMGVVRVRQMSPQEGWISGARVASEHRRHGIGTLLNNAAADWLREREIVVARLAAEVVNDAAQAQVEKLGYRPVAEFIFGHRTFTHHGSDANGGKRLPAPERFDLAPSAEAEPAFIVFSSGNLARSGHGLFAPEGWDMRRLRPADLIGAARRRQLWTAPSGWTVTVDTEEGMWVGVLVTTPDDATHAVRGLIDLAEERHVKAIEMVVPRLEWLEDALVAEHLQLDHANTVYEKTLS